MEVGRILLYYIMKLPYDQYQRYKTMSHIIEKLKKNLGLDSVKILEIGANEQKNLSKFLDKDIIYYTDIELPDSLKNDPFCFLADATNLNTINDQEFDIVIACDVLEHIALEKRAQFLTELNRVSKYCCIICFPHKTKAVENAEMRSNTYFKVIGNQDYRWLYEHSQQSLPSINEINYILDLHNIPFTHFEHGDITVWELMLKNHFYSCFAQDVIPYREEIDEFYNNHIYAHDISDDNYRSFYILYKKEESSSMFKNISNSLFEKKEINDDLLILYSLSNDLRDLSQLNLRLSMNKNAQDTMWIKENIETSNLKYFNKIQELEQEKQQLTIKLYNFESKYKALQNEYDAYSNMNEILKNKVLDFERKNQDLEAQNLLEKNNFLDIKTQYENLQSQNSILLDKVQHFEMAYNQIIQSSSWKITKPFRYIKRNLGLPIHKSSKKLTNNMKNNSLDDTFNYYGELPNINEDIFFSILVPLFNTKEIYLIDMINSILEQRYSNWELCLADASDSTYTYIETICKEYAQKDSRIKYRKLSQNRGISYNTNACFEMSSGNYIVLCDHDDILSNMALYYNAVAIQETNFDVSYSDEDHINKLGHHINPLYKPDWSPDLLYSQMYICHLLVFRRELFEKVGMFNSEFDGAQDYDLMLRFAEHTDKICHIPKILYSWRETDNSTSVNADSKPYAHTSGKNALDQHLKRMFGDSAYSEETPYTFVYNSRFPIQNDIKVSIIIPMKDKSYLSDACIKSILEKSSYSNYEILILNNNSCESETFEWLKTIGNLDPRIRVIDANFEFNWSKLNNFGIEHADGDVFIFLNNDTLISSHDWIERLCEKALRCDVGVVGPLLLYEDQTIQHAGIVVGIGGWADHIFKGLNTVHFGSPFISPMVARNVLSVTGACMAISRKTIEKIGKFDEEFIICGSDVEIGIRAYDYGLHNIYDPNVVLYHLESKSRDSYIPEIDFKKSFECYTPYRELIDPYYNINLDQNNTTPTRKVDTEMDIERLKKFLRSQYFTRTIYKKLHDTIVSSYDYNIAEIQPINAREYQLDDNKIRINLLVPSINKQDVFGGIATALKFFFEFINSSSYYARIIVTDAAVDLNNIVEISNFNLISSEENSNIKNQIIDFGDRYNKTIPVDKNDIFIATAWWTAYTIYPIIQWQNKTYNVNNALLYFIQDYEPGFYPWSSRYLLADSTYKLDINTIAIFNSELLMNYFKENKYTFYKELYFNPVLNENLKKFLLKEKNNYKRKKQLLVYGRPSVQRNAFEVIILALKKWVSEQPDIDEWNIISAGEEFSPIELGHNKQLVSLGKLSLEEYAKTMLETMVGVSLMVSPHPSYPPLEMSTFGIKTITNCYSEKDLSSFNSNIISLENCSPSCISDTILDIIKNYDVNSSEIIYTDYINNTNSFYDLISEIETYL